MHISNSHLLDLVPALEKLLPSVKVETPLALRLSVPLTVNDTEINSKDADDKIKETFFRWAEEMYSDLRVQRNERAKQARATFIVALTSLCLGLLLTFCSIIFSLVTALPITLVTTAASIISNVVSGLTFGFNREASNKLDQIANELTILVKAYTALQYIYLISDFEKREKAIEDLARSIFQK